jgi:hypothetical protein
MENLKTKLDHFKILYENRIKGHRIDNDIIQVKFTYQEKNKYFVKGTLELTLNKLAPFGKIISGFKDSSLTLQFLTDLSPDYSVDFDKDTPPLKIQPQDIYKLYMLKKHPLLFKIKKPLRSM